MTRVLLRLFAPALVLGAALLGGFGWFANDAARFDKLPADADGIVVLAGGEQRVELGLLLLRAGVAPRLLVSGVGPGVTVPDLIGATWPGIAAGARRRSVLALGDTVLPLDRIVLGHAARTTVGNASEAAAWAREDGLHRVVVVTAGYHMRRALIELGRAMPSVTLERCAVHPAAPLRLLAVEYLKLVAVLLDTGPAPPPVAPI